MSDERTIGEKLISPNDLTNAEMTDDGIPVVVVQAARRLASLRVTWLIDPSALSDDNVRELFYASILFAEWTREQHEIIATLRAEVARLQSELDEARIEIGHYSDALGEAPARLQGRQLTREKLDEMIDDWRGTDNVLENRACARALRWFRDAILEWQATRSTSARFTTTHQRRHPMTDRIADITARVQKATPGPWRGVDGDLSVGQIVTVYASDRPRWIAELPNRDIYNDADFITHAREDIPFLLAELDRVTGERNEARRESHQYWEAMEGWKHGCGVTEAELQRYKDVVARAVNFASSRVGFCDDEGDNAREILSILATLKEGE